MMYLWPCDHQALSHRSLYTIYQEYVSFKPTMNQNINNILTCSVVLLVTCTVWALSGRNLCTADLKKVE